MLNVANFAARAIQRAREDWNKQRFQRVARRVVESSPLRVRGKSPVFLSMMCHRDIVLYLLAIKSLYVRFGEGRIAIIDDGSLDPDDKKLLCQHLPGLEIIPINSIDTGTCPRGGTWERLVHIVALSQQDYVIQVDADTLALADIPEALQAWRDNASFILGTGSGREIKPVAETAQMVRSWIKTHGWRDLTIGVAAEAALDSLPAQATRSYVHASSGFAGFARGAFAFEALEGFSNEMSGLLGTQRWYEWGTEQIASNYILANSASARVLPFPRYACYEPHLHLNEQAFLHFIGTHRYERGVYQRSAAEFLGWYRSRRDQESSSGNPT